MQFRVLTADGADAAEWRKLVNRLPACKRDIHFLPEYARIYQRTHAQQPWLAVYGDESSFVLQPFVSRRLNELPFLRDLGVVDPRFEVANPYGYGGAVTSVTNWGERSALMCGFQDALVDYCRQKRFASEFAVLHPRLGGAELIARCTELSTVALKKVVYIDLAASREERWHALRKGHKSSVKKALRSGIEVRRVPACTENLAELKRLYYETMRRNRAEPRWYLPQEYFDCCVEFLGEERVSIFFACKGEATAAASMLIHDFDTVYYHFSGSDARFSEFGAGTLMVFEMAQWAAEAGYRWMHLGGGVSSAEDDSLFRFKSGFSPVHLELQGYGRVLHEPTYAELCDLKRRHEERTGRKPLNPEYFPLYRR